MWVFWQKPAWKQPPLGSGPQVVSVHPAGYTLIELLVAVAIVVVLLILTGSAFYSARASQAKQATQTLLAKIDDVISRQFASYAERRVPDATSSADRSVRLRRLASAEMPDNWEDVRLLKLSWEQEDAEGAPPFDVLRTPAQEVYVSILETANPSDEHGSAECLFMSVMQSGLADCVSCVGLGAGDIGDLDGDGAPEFLDAWGQPIRYVLWPAALEIPPGQTRYFSTSPPFLSVAPAPAKGGTMRPLIVSCGPDELGSIKLNTSGNLSLGEQCGDPSLTDPDVLAGGFYEDPGADDNEDCRHDNITNFDEEAKR